MAALKYVREFGKRILPQTPVGWSFVILFPAPPCLATSPQLPETDRCSCSAEGIGIATAPPDPPESPQIGRKWLLHVGRI